MNHFQHNTKASLSVPVSLLGAALCCSAVLSPASAAPAASEVSSPAIASLAEVNRLAGGPTLVTLHFKNAPLRTVTEELAKQAKIKLTLLPDEMWQRDPRTVTIDIDAQPFWPAVRAVTRAAGIKAHLSRWEGRSTWILTDSDSLSGPGVSQGLFYIVANGVRREYFSSATMRFGGQSTREDRKTAQISVTGFIDPKLNLIGHASNIELDQVIDDKGKSLKPTVSSEPYYSLESSSNQTFFASLSLPRDPGKRIARFKGSLRFLQSKQSIVWEIPNVLNARDVTKTITIDGVTSRYVLNDVRKTGDQYQVRITVLAAPTEQPDEGPQKSRYPFRFQDQAAQFMRLLDVKGRPFGSTGYGSSSSGGQSNVAVTFVKSRNSAKNVLGEPSKLILEFPTGFTEIKVPFEFTNLPMP